MWKLCVQFTQCQIKDCSLRGSLWENSEELFQQVREEVSVYIYMCVCVFVCVCVYDFGEGGTCNQVQISIEGYC